MGSRKIKKQHNDRVVSQAKERGHPRNRTLALRFVPVERKLEVASRRAASKEAGLRQLAAQDFLDGERDKGKTPKRKVRKLGGGRE